MINHNNIIISITFQIIWGVKNMHDINILIFENEAFTAINLQEKFKFWGYKSPYIVSSKKEALKIAGSIKPDLALIDVEIKNKEDMIEIAKRVSEEFDTAVVYIIPMINEDIMGCIKPTKPYGFLLKPLEENQIKYKVEEALYTRKLVKKLIASK